MIRSYNAFDATKRIPVSIIVSYDTQGKIVPLYIRIHGIAKKILSSEEYHSDSLGLNLLAFRCQWEEGDLLRTGFLYYHKREGIWMIEGG